MKTTGSLAKNNIKFTGDAWTMLGKVFTISASILTFTAISPFKAEAAQVGSIQSKILASSTFDNGTDGWRVEDIDSTVDPPSSVFYTPTYLSTGGNPGGYIEQIDPSTGGWFFKAPTKFLGNMSAAYNGILSFDSKMPLKGTEVYYDNDVVLTGGGYTLWFDNANNPGVDWTSYNISLNEASGWKIRETGIAPTQTQMLSVLSSLNDLRILGEYSFGQETVGLDNVVLRSGTKSVPEPLTILGSATALGIGGLLKRQHSKKQNKAYSRHID